MPSGNSICSMWSHAGEIGDLFSHLLGVVARREAGGRCVRPSDQLVRSRHPCLLGAQFTLEIAHLVDHGLTEQVTWPQTLIDADTVSPVSGSSASV